MRSALQNPGGKNRQQDRIRHGHQTNEADKRETTSDGWTRRKFVESTAIAGAAVAAAPFLGGQAPAYAQARKVHYLQWTSFIPEADAEIIAVVCHERYTVGGANPLDPKYAQEFADWCAPGAPTYEAILAGDKTLDEEGISTTPKA